MHLFLEAVVNKVLVNTEFIYGELLCAIGLDHENKVFRKEIIIKFSRGQPSCRNFFKLINVFSK